MKRLIPALCLSGLALWPAPSLQSQGMTPPTAPSDVRSASQATHQQAPAAPKPSTQKVPLDQARAVALRAVEIGQFDVAADLALQMLQRDPEDSFAHLIMASVMMQTREAAQAGPAARAAFRYADSPRQKHEAARVVALSEAQQDKYLSAQIWMRRALQAAPNDVTRTRSAKEFKALRHRARLRINLSGAVIPSSNVNNGAADRFNVADGVPLVGILPATSRALSGTIVQAGGNFTYRLQRGARSETHLTGAVQVRRVELSQEARDIAPGVENADYGATFAELGLRHVQGLGDGFGVLAAHLSFGQVWNGGDRSYDTMRAGADWAVPVAGTSLSLGIKGQRRFNDADDLPDVETLGFSVGLNRALDNGDVVALTAGLSEARSENTQANAQTKSLRLSYARAEPIGPVSLSASYTASETHYPDYRILFFAVDGGRQDMRQEARVNVTLDTLSYAGFVPTLSLTAEKTRSNVSRFETEEMSVSLGLRSQF